MAHAKAEQKRASRVHRALQSIRENRVMVEKPLAEAMQEERSKKRSDKAPEANVLFTNVSQHLSQFNL